jgi:hypothetical protein
MIFETFLRENNISIPCVLRGTIKPELYRYQKEFFQQVEPEKIVLYLKARCIGMTTTFLLYALWFAKQNPEKTIFYLGHNMDVSYYFLDKFSKTCPKQWIKQKDHDQILLTNGSKILTRTNPRGLDIDLLLVDEVDFIGNKLIEFDNVSKKTIISSSIKTVSNNTYQNSYMKMFKEATCPKYILNWYEVPSRTDKWFKETLETHPKYELLPDIENSLPLLRLLNKIKELEKLTCEIKEELMELAKNQK